MTKRCLVMNRRTWAMSIGAVIVVGLSFGVGAASAVQVGRGSSGPAVPRLFRVHRWRSARPLQMHQARR